MEEPVRMCLACRRRAPQSRLLRLSRHGDVVTLDIASATTAPGRGTGAASGRVGAPPARDAVRRGRAGRGAYLCAATACADRALRADGAPLLRALRVAGGTVEVDAGIRAAIHHEEELQEERAAAAAPAASRL